MFYRYLSRTSFKQQLTVIFTVAIISLALLSSLMNSWKASQSMRSYMLEQGLRIAENLARQSGLALLYHSADNAKNVVATTLAFPDVIEVKIIDAESGKVLVSESKLLEKQQKFKENRLSGSAFNTISAAILEQETSQAWYFAAPVYVGQVEASPFDMQENKPQFLGYVSIGLGKGTLQRLVKSLVLGDLFVTLTIAGVLWFIVRLLAQRMIHPLNVLSNLMHRAELGESGMRAQSEGPKDIVEMASAFNKMMDVLDERELELVKSRDEALKLVKIKSQFASTVSHELRTPLNGVVGMLDMLKETPLTKRQQECVEVAWKSSHSLMELINDILDFSKMEAGKLELEETDVDLQKLVEDILEILAKQIQHKNLNMGYLMADDVPQWVRSDPMRLKQVLMNLLGNALKFTDNGEVGLRITSWGCINGEHQLCFEVIDTGIGMSETAASRVFESFAQADSSTTRKYGGTGLGLAISKQLVELMRGEIRVITIQGKGTTFQFMIPCKVSEQLKDEENIVLPSRPALIVDSDGIVRDFIEKSLSRHGMLCYVQQDVESVMSELIRFNEKGYPFVLMIIDKRLMDEAGVGFISAIRADSRISDIRILALDRYATLMSAMPVGVDGYLVKPPRFQRLLNKVAALLSNEDKPKASLFISPVHHSNASMIPKGYRVLVADDNRTNQMVAGRMMTSMGCQCDFALNGREALEAALTKEYDLILMDCSMPEMDGYEATRKIREFEVSRGRHTLIFALTANTQPGDQEHCISAGMNDYISKPVTLVALREKLEYWLTHISQNSEVFPEDGAFLRKDQNLTLDRLIFNTLWESVGATLEHAINVFLEDLSTSLIQLERAVVQENTQDIQTIVSSMNSSRANMSAVILDKAAHNFSNKSFKDMEILLVHLRKAFEEVASSLGKKM